MLGFFNNVIVLDLAPLFGKSFTSCPGVGSGVLSEKQNLVRHFFSLFDFGAPGGTIIFFF
jgi:hypothetical protein